MPIKTEMTVLSNDEPRATLGWVVQELNGVPLYPIIDGLKGETPVPMTEELVVGADYVASGLFGELLRWTVGKDDYGEYTISSGPNLIGVLQRCDDERECWVVTGQINTRRLTKLLKNTSDG